MSEVEVHPDPVLTLNLGLGLPGRSTLTELVNAISSATREKILDAQLFVVLGEGWNDFKKLTVDSTAVEGNVDSPVRTHPRRAGCRKTSILIGFMVAHG